MTLDSRGVRRCDECGRPTPKPSRIHKGCEYCATCYSRVFVPAACTQCGISTRVHQHSQTEAVCPRCVRAARTCQRCSKPLPQATVLVEGGALCGPCSIRLIAPEPCERCGRPSSRLSRSPSQGITERVCDHCRTQGTHKACSYCGKHRPVAVWTADGKARCDHCRPGQEASHACPDCQVEVPGAGAGRCRRCQIATQVRANLALTKAGLEHPWSRDLVDGFAQWFVADGTLSTAAIQRMPRYEAFFQQLEAAVGEQGVLNLEALLANFRVEQLRRFKVPMRFLQTVHGLQIDAKSKADHADRTRVVDLLAAARPSIWFDVLKAYADWLYARKTIPRTMRLYVSAAHAMCKALELTSREPPDRTAFERYLRNHRGQRTNLSVFVTFCRRELGWEVSLPTLTAANGPVPVDPTVRELTLLLDKVRRGVGDSQAHLQRAIALLLGFDELRLSEVQWTFGRRSGRPLAFVRGTETVRLPKAVGDLAAQWLRHGAPATTPERLSTDGGGES